MPLNRRKQQRFKLETEINAQITDQNGGPVGSEFYGCLRDISVGGACFNVQCSNQDLGQTLLAETITLILPLEKGASVKVSGLIVGANFDHSSSYSIHLQFPKKYSDESLKNLIHVCEKHASNGGANAAQKESDGDSIDPQTRAEANLAVLSHLMEELAKVQKERLKAKQSQKTLEEAKAPKKPVEENRESSNKLEEEPSKTDKETSPQKAMRPHEEIEALILELEKAPSDMSIIQRLVDLYTKYELYEAAIEILDAALKLAPKVAELQCLLGDTYYRAERFQESLAPLRLAVRLDPKIAKAHFFLSMANDLVGKEEIAEKHYRIAIALDPDIEDNV